MSAAMSALNWSRALVRRLLQAVKMRHRGVARKNNLGIKGTGTPKPRHGNNHQKKRKFYESLYGDWRVHERMLADSPRIHAYIQAVERHVKRGDVVLDVGTGSGILSFLAKQAGARKVFAIEVTDIIETAKYVSRLNNFANIEFIRLHSREFASTEKADVILHEQMPNWIDKEYMIPNILDLRDRLLAPGGRIIPSKFEVYVEPVQLKTEYRQPFLWEQQINGVDFSALKDIRLECAADYWFIEIDPNSVEKILATSEPLFRFDLETLLPGEIAKEFKYVRKLNENGRLDALCFFWRSILDDQTFIDTRPKSTNRAYHWKNLIFRVEAERVFEGETIEFCISMANLAKLDTWNIKRIKQL